MHENAPTPFIPHFGLRQRLARDGKPAGDKAMPQFEVEYHAAIVKQACPQDPTIEAGLAMIVAANVATDLDQFHSELHFDNCAFGPGVQRIRSLWQLIESPSVEQNPFVLFGTLTHTVEDFYAHSNWVELHQGESQVPVWDLDLASLPPQIVSGTFLLDSPKLCGPGAPTHEQLNKDSPTSSEGGKVVQSGPNQGRKLFDLAFDAAVRATRVQFERLQTVIG